MEFKGLKEQYINLKQNIDQAIADVIEDSSFIGGSEVQSLEAELVEYIGVRKCVTCGNGTDALTLALKTWGIGNGDAVFVPDFSFFSTAECPAGEGATPVFIGVDQCTFNLDPARLESAIVFVRDNTKLKPKVVIAVDLFGQTADYKEIRSICDRYDLFLLEDGAQGFGAMQCNKRACSFGDISTTSFFPAKPLGCYGDGGAVFTDNIEWARKIRSLAVHGKGESKYDNLYIGMNSRLDTLQAAVIRVKLQAFIEYELKRINEIADLYKKFLPQAIDVPVIKPGNYSSWAQYTIKLPRNVNRKRIQQELKDKNIPTNVYYLKPLHEQKAFVNTPIFEKYCGDTRDICESVLSLPMHPYLKEEEVATVSHSLEKVLYEY